MSRLNWPVLCARVRMPILWIGGALLVASFFTRVPPLLGTAVLFTGLALYFRVGTVRRDPVEVASPVAGRWVAMNSPASRVPSHMMHAYGQTYAIDLAYEPSARPRPKIGWWPLARRPDEFPGYGRPVYAPADGVVVRAHGWERDHWSRTSVPGLLYLVLESVREFFGPSRILGNHVILDLGDGVYAAIAHLRRGSLRVTRGQQVAAGEQLAECGNSGNSSEPHLHFQLMDHRSVLFAAGLPARFEWFEAEGEVRSGMPKNGEAFVAPEPDRSPQQEPA